MTRCDLFLTLSDMSLIRGTSLQGFTELVEELGEDPLALLRAAHLRPEAVGDHDSFVSYRSVTAVLEAAARATGAGDFGRRLGARQGLEILGPLGVAARTAPTVGAALQAIEQYLTVYSPALAVGVRAQPGDALASFDWRLLDPRPPVHRQAAENPIVRMAMTVREGGTLDVGSYGESRIIERRDLDQADVLATDQVLVGRNATRRSYNARIRELLGRPGPVPVAGDTLVCLRNDRKRGLLNGSLWAVAAVKRPRKSLLRYDLAPADNDAAKATKVSINPAFFDGTADALTWPERKRSDEFDFGYVLTVHKAQGSQWDDVVLFDESFAFRENRARWLYTGITRAAKRLTIVV